MFCWFLYSALLQQTLKVPKGIFTSWRPTMDRYYCNKPLLIVQNVQQIYKISMQITGAPMNYSQIIILDYQQWTFCFKRLCYFATKYNIKNGIFFGRNWKSIRMTQNKWIRRNSKRPRTWPTWHISTKPASYTTSSSDILQGWYT